MKRIVALALIFAVLFTFVTVAFADYVGYSFSGIVICTKLTVRKSPSINASWYCRLKNGDIVKVIDDDGKWATIDLASIGQGEGVGYVKSGLVKPTPCFIVLTKSTNGWDDPWYMGLKNGEFSAGEPKLVKSQTAEFYCIQPHKGHAGSSFIRITDVGMFTQDCEPGHAVVMDDKVAVYDYYSSNVIGQLNTNDIVQVLEYGSDWSHIYYENEAGFVDALIETIYLGPVLN